VSLILDALKKSEQQRQREKAPGLQSIHQPVAIATKKSMRPWWLLAAIVVVCNFAFWGYWFWRQQTVASSLTQLEIAQPAIAQTASVAAVAPAATQSADKPPQPQGVEPQEQQAQSEFTRISPREALAPMQSQSASPDAAQRIEEINELPDAVRNSLPAMTFSFHVYSESPEQRTIIINDRRVREGDEISAGLKLQGITQDGVILLFEQHRIHISVLSGW